MLHVSLHEEEVVSLVGRAHARLRFPDLRFADPEAEHVLSRVEVGGRRFEDDRLRAATMETMAIDEVVRGFVRRNPEGLVVALYPGLCTRFSRLDNGTLQWIDLDRPGVAEVKPRLYTTPDRHRVAACRSLTCRCWMAPLRVAQGIPLMLVSQGTLRRCSSAELDRFLLCASEHLPAGSELVLDHDASRPLVPPAPGSRGGCLSMGAPGGAVLRYPRFRFSGAAAPGGSPASRVAHLVVV